MDRELIVLSFANEERLNIKKLFPFRRDYYPDERHFYEEYNSILRGHQDHEFRVAHCILPCVEGLIFQFGPDDVKNSSEFVYLPGHRDLFKVPPYFQITCSRGTYTLSNVETTEQRIWSRLRKNDKIFVNDKPVKVETKLEVGDCIKIIYSKATTPRRRLPEDKDKDYRVPLLRRRSTPLQFLFEKCRMERIPKFDKSLPKKSPAVEQALENPYILCKIFENFDIYTLRVVRLVSHLWRGVSLPQFKDGTATAISIYDYKHPFQSMTFLRLLQGIPNFGPHSNWSLDIRCDDLLEIWEDEKFVRDSQKFLDYPHHGFKRIRAYLGELLIHGNIKEAYFTKSFLWKLLKSDHSATIEELEVILQLNKVSFEGFVVKDTAPKGWTPLPRLRCLEVKFEWSSEDEAMDADACRECVRWLLPWCKGVRRLALTSASAKCNTWVLWELVAYSRVEYGFVNLNEIKVSKVKKEGLTLLQELGGYGKLKKVEVNGFEEDCRSEDLNRWLAKHAMVLEEVVVDVPEAWGYVLPLLPRVRKKVITVVPEKKRSYSRGCCVRRGMREMW